MDKFTMKKILLFVLFSTNVFGYDNVRAFKRVHYLFCGSPVSFSNLVAFKLKDDLGQKTNISSDLNICLNSVFWKTDGLHRIADKKIKPIDALGINASLYILGDYRYDYRLYSYVMSDGRDMRELLTAQYHIALNGVKTFGQIPVTPVSGKLIYANGQPLDPTRRAGMLTTQWFIAANTMFAKLPRTTASQAYRAYLGLDIALSQGLNQVPNEPRDVDGIGIDKPACAGCHTTLDPLAYPFSPYLGLEANNNVGVYDASRTTWSEQGDILGNPVSDLLAWAQVAASSDEFKKAMTRDLMEYAFGGRKLSGVELTNFNNLWVTLPSDSYSANALIHRIVELESFTTEPLMKRADALFNDLKSSLELPGNVVCVELNQFDCIKDLYLFSLGGNEPFIYQQYSRLESFNVFSVANFERVILSSCSNSVEIDYNLSSQKIYKYFGYSDLVSTISDNSAKQLMKELYNRLYRRDYTIEEESILLEMKNSVEMQSQRGEAFAKTMCMAIGSSMEYIFI
jgi:hypothetical protein